MLHSPVLQLIYCIQYADALFMYLFVVHLLPVLLASFIISTMNTTPQAKIDEMTMNNIVAMFVDLKKGAGVRNQLNNLTTFFYLID